MVLAQLRLGTTSEHNNKAYKIWQVIGTNPQEPVEDAQMHEDLMCLGPMGGA